MHICRESAICFMCLFKILEGSCWDRICFLCSYNINNLKAFKYILTFKHMLKSLLTYWFSPALPTLTQDWNVELYKTVPCTELCVGSYCIKPWRENKGEGERRKIEKDESVCSCSVQWSVGHLPSWDWAAFASADLISWWGWKGPPFAALSKLHTLCVIYPEHITGLSTSCALGTHLHTHTQTHVSYFKCLMKGLGVLVLNWLCSKVIIL